MPTQEVCIVPTKPDNFRLPRERLGISRLDTGPDKPGSHDIVGVLLQQNHDKHHMYFRDIAGHNHIPHAILTTMAMGGTVKELRRAYDDGEAIQRPKTAPDPIAVGEMEDPFKFLDRMQEIEEYSNFLAFFEKEFEANQGQWQDVFNHFVFARNPQSDFLLAQMFEGLYHPLIHLSFGVEFELSRACG
ncbi:hypothetical protein CMQ_2753 [Grosmannia clavigera kw1407]|uniref:HypA-like protein n=1 Tax=Grosmannia clavigera (strain kw1407 / UAMH 11150) TaxID=655863 RepID=F0XGJ4_GROCL|nr:uncharacterized protein CMQ_2753 [Grosmannia clavigera kw1407]EFX02824.1 hypothetical protein CMQ_2753 [Grosmannia clavigera kw1407]